MDSPASTAPTFNQPFNLFLYRKHIDKMGPEETAVARDWCLALIHREHPHLNAEEVDRFYDDLIKVQFSSVDEWTRRMS